jgi:hypothetical protein
MFNRDSSAPKMTGEMDTVPAPAPEPAAAGMTGMTTGAGGFEFYQQ